MITEIKVRAGNFWKPMILKIQGDRIFCQFSYNKTLIDEIRNMEGAKWHGFDEENPRKIWSIKNSQRNWFNIDFLQGKNPYAHYEQTFINFESQRPLFNHQRFMTSHLLTVNAGIWAAEMGTGKTLSFIEVMEYGKKTGFVRNNDECWYIGPKAGVRAVGRELLKWDSSIRPRMFTYEGLVKELRDWTDLRPVPKVVCYDESSKIKNPNAQRSQTSLYLANNVRNKYGREGYIVEMSGSPAPKDPTDWWHQCEVVCPGFLKEGSVGAFKRRLCIIEQRESLITGGVYPHVVTWLDNQEKCSICGQMRIDPSHWDESSVFAVDSGAKQHTFKPSVNEVANLYKRMKGLVIVLFKKDCLDLPDKQYEIITVKPSVEILRAAKLIRKMSTRTVEALNLMRELSDGFQYKQVKSGEKVCAGCFGRTTISEPKIEQGLYSEPNTGLRQTLSEGEYETVTCPTCGGSGVEPVYERETLEIGTLKDEVFIEELDAASDIGRYIVWGGFTGTIDRLVRIAHQQGWATLRVDGRGYFAQEVTGEAIDPDIFLNAMDRSYKDFENLREKYPRICFVGHPEAGGMALTLTAASVELFFSNSFKGEARIQSEDRPHRPGMDENRGLLIKDLFLLPADEYVYNNLKKKRELQSISLGEFHSDLTQLEEKYEKEIV
jgi:hypothetical protein